MPTPTPIPATSLSVLAGSPGSVIADPAGTTMDATNGNTFPNSGQTLVRVQNTTASPVNLTIVPVETVGGLTLASDVRAIPGSGTAGGIAWIARLDPAVYGRAVKVTGPATLKLTILEP